MNENLKREKIKVREKRKKREVKAKIIINNTYEIVLNT
jgi:hypothetical protein